MSLTTARSHIQFGNDLLVDILGKEHIVNMCIPSEMLEEALISFSGGISGKVSYVKLSVSLSEHHFRVMTSVRMLYQDSRGTESTSSPHESAGSERLRLSEPNKQSQTNINTQSGLLIC